MRSTRRRLDANEARVWRRASTGKRPPWRSPEIGATREQRFRRLYMQIGGKWPPAARDPAQLPGELFAEIAHAREETDTRE